MIVYHGTQKKELKLKKNYPSRYGIPAMFTTDNVELARSYAKLGGAVYRIEISNPVNGVHVDFDHKSTYHNAAAFQHIVNDFYKRGYNMITIADAIDRPNKLSKPIHANIYVIYNVDIIHSITKI